MAVTVGGQAKRLGLALSGGGFRAAAFHLGVCRRLQEMRLLDKLDLISCVSGGSIAGAFLALNWGKPDVLDRLDEYLRTRSIAVASVIGGILDPFASRLDHLAQAYDEHLFHGATLGQLTGGPRIYLNATNLATGNLFSFVAGGGGKAEMGEWELDFAGAENFPICLAVAASSAFPPVFPPLKLDQHLYEAAGVDYVTLSDGGVYDNLGVNPLFRRRHDLAYLLVSDAGKPFEVDQRPVESGTGVLTHLVGVLMEQVRGLQFERLRLWGQVEKATPIWFSIDSTEGEARPGDAAFASSVGTNLKRLSGAEMETLGRHGGALLSHRLATYASELV